MTLSKNQSSQNKVCLSWMKVFSIPNGRLKPTVRGLLRKKIQIKEEEEKMFDGAKVASVNTMNYKGKPKRRGMIWGKTAKRKKAIVKLTADSKDIEIFQGM